MKGVQPCDFWASCVWSNILVSSQPMTSTPGLPIQRVWLASFAKFRCSPLAHMSTRVHCFVLGSYMLTWREPVLTGNAIADARLDPCLQNAGLSCPRVCDAVQILP